VNAQAILRLLTYVTAGLILALGITVLLGYSIPDSLPTNFRIVLGIMMILYSIYRIVTITIKKRAENDTEE
jgi:sulfite exporter TauE/SafE